MSKCTHLQELIVLARREVTEISEYFFLLATSGLYQDNMYCTEWYQDAAATLQVAEKTWTLQQYYSAGHMTD